jgi:hypothetical protein
MMGGHKTIIFAIPQLHWQILPNIFYPETQVTTHHFSIYRYTIEALRSRFAG